MRQKQSFITGTETELDPVISALAREHRLGELLSVYHASQRGARSWRAGWILVIASFVYAIPGFLFFFIGQLTAPTVGIIFFLFGFVALATGISLLLPKRIYAHWHLSFWENGFVQEKGQVSQVLRWDQIDKIEGRVVDGYQQGKAFFNYKISGVDGSVVKLDNTFPELDLFIGIVLAQYAHQAAARPELHRVPLRYKKFPVFILNRLGISDKQGQNRVPWQNIQELTIENGAIAVLKREPGSSESEEKGRTVHQAL